MMDRKYTVMFALVGGFKAGARVLGSDVASDISGVEYLLRVGAIANCDRIADIEEAHGAALVEEADRKKGAH